MKLGLLIVHLPHGLRDFWITLHNLINNLVVEEKRQYPL
jgi:hypothetical protein